VEKLTLSLVMTTLKPELKALKAALSGVLDSDHDYLKQLHGQVLAAPGKQLRPALIFLVGRMLGVPKDTLVTIGAAFELIHTATLLHDDVIDHAETRRGRPTLNVTEQNTKTILFGDLLYTKANSLAITAGRLDVLALISNVTEQMIEGELLQEKMTYRLDIEEQTYFAILKRKTAFLFGGATQAAGMMANLLPEALADLYRFGFELGVSFQLVDDLLDYQGRHGELGKPVLSDLAEGKMTLPTIRAYQENPDHFGPLIEQVWSTKDPQLLQRLAQDLLHTQAFEETVALSRFHAQAAQQSLEHFPHSRYRQWLQTLPNLMINRKR
jgi:octaprenyl-diphosphate synthase